MSLNIHQKISLAVILAFSIAALSDALFHLLLGILHLSYEAAEWGLEHFIEHLFDTGMRETQLIVFYLLFFAICFALYRLLPLCYCRLMQKLHQQVQETLAQWRSLSIVLKIAWWSCLLLAGSGWLFLS